MKKTSPNGLTSFGKWVKMQALETDTELQQIAKDIGTSKNYLSAILHGTRNSKKYTQLIIQRLGGDPECMRDIIEQEAR